MAALQVYLLGTVDFEAALALQRRLAYEVAGDRDRAALIVCEHPPLITVGRQGSHAHILCDQDELHARRWRLRWVNRGGGCQLHLLGQLAVYPVLALDRLGLGLQAYLDQLRAVLTAVLTDFGVHSQARPGQAEVWVGHRPIACLGVAVRDWVCYFGGVLNLNPDLAPFRLVRCGGPAAGPMTSLERERHGPLRPALVRESLLEHFAARFALPEMTLFFDHPALCRKASSDAVASSR
jgi:lipoyl(octanoyl) transferase